MARLNNSRDYLNLRAYRMAATDAAENLLSDLLAKTEETDPAEIARYEASAICAAEELTDYVTLRKVTEETAATYLASAVAWKRHFAPVLQEAIDLVAKAPAQRQRRAA